MSVSRKGQERTDPGMTSQNKSTVRDMTTGSITGHLIAFSIPLLLGNVFQMLYNTVDSIVVGNFVGKQALAAISSTTMIVNIMIFFFNGFAVGGGVVISQYFGAKRLEDLHKAVETAIRRDRDHGDDSVRHLLYICGLFSRAYHASPDADPG